MKNMIKGKKKAVLMMIAAASVLMTACGNKEYLKDIKASDYVTLGNYTGIEASAAEPAVEDGLVDMYIKINILPQYPQYTTSEDVTDGEIEIGDVANIDFVGYMDGEAFEGGTGAGYDLMIGSHQFIDGFEDGLVGAKVGEKLSLDLAFPDPYQKNPDLSGVPVVFDVTINSITRLGYTDELVQALEIDGCTTKKELEDYLYNYFYNTEVQAYENVIENTLTDTIMADCTFKEPPAKMVDRFYQNLTDAMSAQAMVQGATLSQYMLAYYGMSEEEYEATFKEEALAAAQQYIMYQAIADVEGLNPTEEQIQEEISSRVEAYNYESEEEYKKSTDLEMLREQLMSKNVMAFLKENGNIETITAEDAAE